MPKKYTVIIEKDEDERYVSEVVGLPGCHTQGKTIDQLMERTKEAILLYLKSAKYKDVYSEFIGVYQLEI